MENLFKEIGSAKHNIGTMMSSLVSKEQSLEINGIHLSLGDTLSEGTTA